MVKIAYGNGITAFGGDIILSRQFYRPDTQEYIEIEAHEGEKEGQFKVALWVPDGNDGDHGMSGGLRHVVKKMNEYRPPAGFVEMAIPEDARC